MTHWSLSHRPSQGRPPRILWVQKSNQGSFQTKLLPTQESLVWEPEVSLGSLGAGGLARGGDDTPGPEVWKLRETRDTPLSGGRDLVDLLHSLATTLKFLQNAHIQALP